MSQYIDKDALVAEIKKLIDEIYAGRPFDSLSREQQVALWYVKSIMLSINTLEEKEVDLEKVFLDEYSKFSNDVDAMDYAFPIDLADYKDFAKHFFELGFKAQKGE